MLGGGQRKRHLLFTHALTALLCCASLQSFMSEMGTRFPGINSDLLDVRLGDGQITWTENTSELSAMSEHGGSSHGLG